MKIISLSDFQQTFFFQKTKGTVRLHIFWAPHPIFILPNFENVFLSAITTSTLCAGQSLVPILPLAVDLVQAMHHPAPLCTLACP